MDIVTPAVSAMPLANAATVPVTPTQPDERAAARFAEVMGTPQVAPPLTLDPTNPSLRIGEVASTGSMGDRIINGMQGVSESFQTAWNSAAATLDGTVPMSTQDILKLQMNLTQVAVQYELVGKAISRTTQNIDQLVKVQ